LPSRELHDYCYCIAVGKVAVHGHRGARARRPENTIAAFQYAIDAGADAIEMDIVVTADGVAMVAHDPLPSLPFAEVRRRWPHVPTLEEVVRLADRGAFLFNIELKPFADPERLVELVAPAAALGARVMFQSFDFAILHALERRIPEVPRGALFEQTSEDFVSIARRAQAGIAVPEFHLVSADKVRAAHDAGITVLTWTPNRPPQWEPLIAAGVDGLITDDPAALLRYLGRA
jgi:glycerophosphoryl diester phosphodiesterase